MASQFPYKKVLMVGATSGIGEALAKTMIAQNIHVVAVGRRAEKLSAFEKTHGSDHASASQFDISNLSAIPEWT